MRLKPSRVMSSFNQKKRKNWQRQHCRSCNHIRNLCATSCDAVNPGYSADSLLQLWIQTRSNASSFTNLSSATRFDFSVEFASHKSGEGGGPALPLFYFLYFFSIFFFFCPRRVWFSSAIFALWLFLLFALLNYTLNIFLCWRIDFYSLRFVCPCPLAFPRSLFLLAVCITPGQTATRTHFIFIDSQKVHNSC